MRTLALGGVAGRVQRRRGRSRTGAARERARQLGERELQVKVWFQVRAAGSLARLMAIAASFEGTELHDCK
jgi:hypothetical protein